MFELVLWLNKEFGVQMNIDITQYAPTETPFPKVRQLVIRFFRGSEPSFKSLKVRDMIAAIEAKHWPNDASS